MEWYVFALLAPAFWGLNNVFIKFLITNKFKGYFPTIATIFSMDAFFAVVVLALFPIEVVFPYSALALIVGFLPLIAFWFYSKALLIEEVSRVATLFQLIPVFVVFLSVVFLSEVLGLQRYIGIGLVVLAATLISFKKSFRKTFSGAVKFMVPFALILAVLTIANKLLLVYLDFWSVFFWNTTGTFCGVLLLFTQQKSRNVFRETLKSIGKRTILAAFVGEGFFVTGTVCSLIALSLVDASLASSFFALQPFYVFFYILLLSIFLPSVLKEEITKAAVILKITAIALMFIGTWLIL
jgi:drug/metabolite transporter (DMT)-like permease